jgi:hypothetical protein
MRRPVGDVLSSHGYGDWGSSSNYDVAVDAFLLLDRSSHLMGVLGRLDKHDLLPLPVSLGLSIYRKEQGSKAACLSIRIASRPAAAVRMIRRT